MREIKPGDKIKVIGLKNEDFADRFKEHVGKEYTVEYINCEYDGTEYARLENCDFMPYLYNCELVDESKENEMTLGDLKTGMRLITRDGEEYIVLKNVNSPFHKNIDMFVCIDGDKYEESSNYTQDLLCMGWSELDIVKVYAQNCGDFLLSNVLNCPIEEMDLIWERKENKSILTDDEKEYLNAVIKPFKNQVEYINKSENGGFGEYAIFIALQERTIKIPICINDMLYSNMIINKQYTLEELGLNYE